MRISTMHQVYHANHIHTQKVALDIISTTAPAVNNMACFSISAGKAISVDDETYLLTSSQTGIAGLMGYYAAQAVEPVHGFPSMVSACSCAVTLTGLPPDAVIMPFHTYLDLSAAPSLGITDPSITWFPVGYSTNCLDHTATPAKQLISFEQCFPVENDPSNARYFGVGIFGTFTAAARLLLGSISLRQVTSEIPLFNPNK